MLSLHVFCIHAPKPLRWIPFLIKLWEVAINPLRICLCPETHWLHSGFKSNVDSGNFASVSLGSSRKREHLIFQIWARIKHEAFFDKENCKLLHELNSLLVLLWNNAFEHWREIIRESNASFSWGYNILSFHGSRPPFVFFIVINFINNFSGYIPITIDHCQPLTPNFKHCIMNLY